MGKNIIVQERLVRTTLDLPRDLLERSNRVVDEGKVKSRNLLIIAALAQYLDTLERTEIEETFAHMRDDAVYRRLALSLAEDFSPTVREALATIAAPK